MHIRFGRSIGGDPLLLLLCMEALLALWSSHAGRSVIEPSLKFG